MPKNLPRTRNKIDGICRGGYHPPALLGLRSRSFAEAQDDKRVRSKQADKRVRSKQDDKRVRSKQADKRVRSKQDNKRMRSKQDNKRMKQADIAQTASHHTKIGRVIRSALAFSLPTLSFRGTKCRRISRVRATKSTVFVGADTIRRRSRVVIPRHEVPKNLPRTRNKIDGILYGG